MYSFYRLLFPPLFLARRPSIGPRPPHSRHFWITHNDASQLVGLLWTSDQLVAETSTWQNTQHSQQTSMPPGGIRTHILSRRTAADLRLRPRSHWDRPPISMRFLDHTQQRTTADRTTLDEWSARLRHLYLTTHNTHKRHPFAPVGFEPTIWAGERPQTYALDRAATGTGHQLVLGFYITHNDAPQSIGLLWTSDQLVAETSTWQHTQHSQQTSMPPSGIRTHILSRRTAADLRLRPRGHRHRL